MADRVDDRRHRQQPGNDGEQDGRSDADDLDQGERQQRTTDRAEVVHRALEAIGAPVRAGRDHICQQRVASGHAEPARHPRRGAQRSDLPGVRRDADQSRKDRGRRVTTNGRRPAAVRIVGQRTSPESRHPREAVRHTFDQPERRSGSAERRRQEGGQQGRGTSCPTSASSEAAPIPRTPGVSQRSTSLDPAGDFTSAERYAYPRRHLPPRVAAFLDR